MADAIDMRAMRPTRVSEQLTEARVEKAQPRLRRWILADAAVRGLVLRVEPSGTKSYFARSRIGRGRKAQWAEVRIGAAGQIRLAEARERARHLLADMRAGVDPRLPRLGKTPIGDVIERYSVRLEQREVVKRKHIVRSLRKNLARQILAATGELSRADIVALIDAIERDGRPGAAEDFRKHVVSLLNWAVGAGVIAASPMAGYRRERVTRAQRIGRPKPVFVSSDELAAFWRAAKAASDPYFVGFLRFLLLTGQRRTETALARWDNIELDGMNPAWIIPADVRKTGDELRVPLGEASIAQLQSLPKNTSSLVFPGRGGVPMSGWTKRLKVIKSELDLPAFAFHALRRTYRTGLSELGVSFEIAELMIGHARPDLARRYDHAQLWQQRRAAQELWERHVIEALK